MLQTAAHCCTWNPEPSSQGIWPVRGHIQAGDISNKGTLPSRGHFHQGACPVRGHFQPGDNFHPGDTSSHPGGSGTGTGSKRDAQRVQQRLPAPLLWGSRWQQSSRRLPGGAGGAGWAGGAGTGMLPMDPADGRSVAVPGQGAESRNADLAGRAGRSSSVSPELPPGRDRSLGTPPVPAQPRRSWRCSRREPRGWQRARGAKSASQRAQSHRNTDHRVTES